VRERSAGTGKEHPSDSQFKVHKKDLVLKVSVDIILQSTQAPYLWITVPVI
jgi:hypothetical protein